jgi:hypothetical protein
MSLRRFHLLLLVVGAVVFSSGSSLSPLLADEKPTPLERIAIAPDGRGFVTVGTKTPFRPWGLNYGNNGKLIEDFWDTDWERLAGDFREMKQLGTNVVRVHLQYGKFMTAPDEPNRAAFAQLSRLLRLAEGTGLYLDLTGLASYRPADVPAWYDAMDEPARWTAQAKFWAVIAQTCASSPAVFCYDLMNEPFVPGKKREAGAWRSGQLFGDYDFIQFITLDPAGRTREDVPVLWIRRMTAAIREHDSTHLITVGMLPWSRERGHFSGFVPKKVAPEVDFLCVHLYPDSKKPGEALESLQEFAVGKPVVIEETFPLSCSIVELEEFLRETRKLACGWMGHYDGDSLEELDAREQAGTITIGQRYYRDWLRLFVRLKPEFVP